VKEDAAPQTRDALRDARIVVVEDDSVQLLWLTMLLEDWGARVVGESSLAAAEAAVRATGDGFDLVMSDLRLGGESDGVAAIDRIRLAVGKPIPGLLLTGDTDPEAAGLARASGCTILHKPYEPKRLRAALMEALAPST
jgi:CheY-like chemotaxis protein